ncbi:tryptophan tryptophylquinone biosynthesis enzyme MauG [Candidatus Tenderia electrophaga]|jgi:cytochrome c peroxidase|uniref:Methylamine utilization protein MauG n=1 Tax=Candidatus Tenderia electrophaga TaxID=1748243 RepID=A0A0S2T9S4_9GAMM|nr:tryptophan tryptophylquinone biosynthesis enzyme MauG [Candidatus Tenderia electrophaga]
MKTGALRQKSLTGKIAAALFGMSVVLGVTAANAAPMEPSAEDIKKYLRPMEVPQPKKNLSTPERVELGKFLFFDPRLSGSNFISCATCHNPAMGWSDAQPTAVGHGMDTLDRSTPTILNTAYQRFQFWDGRARTLEQQALGPIVAGGEMAQEMGSLLEELKGIPGYIEMFEAAYPGEGIKEDTIGKAIAAYERTIVSTDAPFDRWLKGVDGAMSKSAIRGFEVFKGKANCTACHDGFNFTDNGFHNIGLPDNADEGRFGIVPVKVLKGAFKTPTLRDVALTAPYMHNGQYATLEEVVEHYNSGGKPTFDNLDPNMKPLNLTKQEKQDLVNFLKALTGDPMQVTVPQLPVK